MSHDAAPILATGSVAEGGSAYLDVTSHFASSTQNTISLLLSAHADIHQTAFHGRTNPRPPQLLLNHGACAAPPAPLQLIVSADTKVKKEFPDQAYGSASVLETWNSASNGERYAVFLFDVSGLGDLGSYHSIHFAFEAQTHSEDVPFKISLHPYSDQDWREATLTWNTFLVSGIGASLGQKSVQENLVFNWNITSWMKNHPSQAKFSFVLVMDEPTGLSSGWWSKEGNYAPRLRLNDPSLPA